jgi:hypothetical protein
MGVVLIPVLGATDRQGDGFRLEPDTNPFRHWEQGLEGGTDGWSDGADPVMNTDPGDALNILMLDTLEFF